MKNLNKSIKYFMRMFAKGMEVSTYIDFKKSIKGNKNERRAKEKTTKENRNV